jgi:hypothetical protein
LKMLDLNGDRRSDIVLKHASALAILVSRP